MAPAADDEDARLFQVWRGSLAVSTNILAKLGSHALDPASAGEAAGAVTGLLRGAAAAAADLEACLLYTSPSPRDQRGSRMPSSA